METADLELRTRRLWSVIAGRPLHEVTIRTGSTRYIGSGDGVASAWRSAVASAEILGGIEMTSACPWEESRSPSALLVRGAKAAFRSTDRGLYRVVRRMFPGRFITPEKPRRYVQMDRRNLLDEEPDKR